ncbi:MAG TPA: phosphatase PAP2 family protein [Mycobacterium sp.]|nr:phosphatase PAP2 family protein [Mycobacterium sp.]
MLIRPRSAITVLPALVAVTGYAVMWLGYRDGWHWLDSVDASSLHALYDVGIKHPSWVRFWEVVSSACGPTAFRLVGAVAVAVELVKRRVRAALFLVVSIEFSGFVTEVAKDLAGRPRPVTALANTSSSSFPSGHALAVMVGVLALLTVLLPMMSQAMGVVAVVGGALIVVAVGFGRVALNLHHPSDVVAGWALGYLYFVVCAWLFRPPPVITRG